MNYNRVNGGLRYDIWEGNCDGVYEKGFVVGYMNTGTVNERGFVVRYVRVKL